jgi:hypothetical protein
MKNLEMNFASFALEAFTDRCPLIIPLAAKITV